jgi:SAM-dependent methyltransferase
MRKDYVEVTEVDVESEAAFQERYWTEIWQDGAVPTVNVQRMSLRDESRVMLPWLKGLPKGARLFDGGCGFGEWTRFLTQAGYPTLGFDISRQTIARLKEAFPDADFAVGNIEDTGQPAKSFDGYFSWGVFEHFEGGMQGCLAEAHRILKTGGLLFLSVPFDNLRMAMQESGRPLPKSPEAMARQRFYQYRLTRQEFAREIACAGFEVLEVKPIHKNQGVVRLLNNAFGVPYQVLPTRVLGRALASLIPATWIAHMILAVGRKRIS